MSERANELAQKVYRTFEAISDCTLSQAKDSRVDEALLALHSASVQQLKLIFDATQKALPEDQQKSFPVYLRELADGMEKSS